MGWFWKFGAGSARKTIESRLLRQEEPVMRADKPAPVPGRQAPRSPSTISFSPAPKLGLRARSMADSAATVHPENSLSHEIVEDEFADALSSAVSQDALSARPQELHLDEALIPEKEELLTPEEPPAPVDYRQISRTSNTFGHSMRFPADDARQAIWAEQRAERGFDDTELWNLDDTFARFVLPRLKALRTKQLNPPAEMALEQWHKLLDKMICAFDLLLPEGGGSWSRGRLSNAERSQLQEGLDLFRQYFFALYC